MAIIDKKLLSSIGWRSSNLLIACLIVLQFLDGCGGAGCKIDKENLAANGLDENYCPERDTTVQLLRPALINNVNVFFDASGSMAGYMPSSRPASELQILIPDILSRLKSKYSNVNFYPIYNSNSAIKSINLNEAQEKILYGGLTQKGGDTYLPSMLDSLYLYLQPNDVNIFISDCIYSPNNAQKKQAEQATKEIREGIDKHTKQFITTVFCLHSKFLQINSSPYYLLLFGNASNSHEIEKLIISAVGDNKQQLNEVNYGLKYNPPYYSILPYSDKSENCYANSRDTTEFLNIMVQNWNQQDDSLSFWIGLNLNDLPSYANTLTYLDSNINVTMEKGKARIMEITTEPPKQLNKDDQDLSKKMTHFVHIRVSNINECIVLLRLGLKFSQPNWIEQLNQEDSEKNGEKTFGLQRLMLGFQRAYIPDGTGYFFKDLKISLIKQ